MAGSALKTVLMAWINWKEAWLFSGGKWQNTGKIILQANHVFYHVNLLACMNMSRIARAGSDFAEGLNNARRAYETFKETNAKIPMADALMEMATNYEWSGYYTKAIENAYAALGFYQDAGYTQGVASAYNE